MSVDLDLLKSHERRVAVHEFGHAAAAEVLGSWATVGIWRDRARGGLFEGVCNHFLRTAAPETRLAVTAAGALAEMMLVDGLTPEQAACDLAERWDDLVHGWEEPEPGDDEDVCSLIADNPGCNVPAAIACALRIVVDHRQAIVEQAHRLALAGAHDGQAWAVWEAE